MYDRTHYRLIKDYGGLVDKMPVYAFALMVFSLAAIGLPGTSGFVGEMLVLVGVFPISTWTALLAGLGVILGAAYMLWLYKRIIFGVNTTEKISALSDLGVRERCIFIPLVVAILLIGVYPRPVLNTMHLSVEKLLLFSQPSLPIKKTSQVK